jgi:hypothetical protein
MTLVIDGGTYTDAADALLDGNHTADVEYDLLAEALDGYGAMAGTDNAAEGFATAYDDAASSALHAYLDIVAAFGNLSQLTQASAYNHLEADRRSVLVSRGHMYDGSTALPEDSTVQVFPHPLPSALGGDGAGPDWWHWVADHVGGLLYPDADVDRLRDAGELWIRAGDSLVASANTCTTAGNLLAFSRAPEIPDALAAYDGLASEIRNVAAAFGELGQACLDFADHVEKVRDEIERLAAELVAWTIGIQVGGVLLGLVSAGVGTAAAQAAQVQRIAATAARIRSALAAFATRSVLALGPVANATKTTARASTVLAKYINPQAVLVSSRAEVRALTGRVVSARKTIDDPKAFDPRSLTGMPAPMVRALLSHWRVAASASGGGVRFGDPIRHGRQIRVMPGYPAGARPGTINSGPYVVVSQNAGKFKIPLEGNPVL